MKKLLALFLLIVLCAAFAADEAHTIVQKGRTFRPGEVTHQPRRKPDLHQR